MYKFSTDLGDERKSDEVRNNAISCNEYFLFGAQNFKHVRTDGDKRFNSNKLH